jgi:hypothetical protein
MDPSKLSPSLAGHLEQAGRDDLVDLVLELHPAAAPETGGASRSERVAAAREAFAQGAAPVEHAVHSAGGQVLDSAWINQTLRARVPAGAVAGLARLDAVRVLDLPHALRRE